MHTRMTAGRAMCLGALMLTTGAFATPEPGATLLREAESRIRAIYDEGAYNPVPFRGEWLADGAGYSVLERVDGAGRPERVAYALPGGERIDGDAAAPPAPDGRVSPDATRRIENGSGDLWIRDLRTSERTRLTMGGASGDVRYEDVSWSPDGARILVVESDDSNVRLRSMLKPVDPSYPEVTETKFARVGGVIPSLRVGVIDVRGSGTRGGEPTWLDVDAPPEGFYLGMVEWAGNSDEVLIEWMSRFRDVREFLLANVRTGTVTRIWRDADPAWVVASYAKNAGLEWIRDGRAFVVLSERDGWRHAYVHARDGTLLHELTSGDFDIIERGPIDEARNLLYFFASPDNATQRYLYRVALDGSTPPERVTPADQPGTHTYDISPDGTWAFHTFSTFDSPPITELVRLDDHHVVRMLEDNAAVGGCAGQRRGVSG